MMGKKNPGNEAVKFPGLFWQGGTAKGNEENKRMRKTKS